MEMREDDFRAHANARPQIGERPIEMQGAYKP